MEPILEIKVSFHPDAETELNNAIEYYEDCQAGLGYDFSLEVYSSIQRIKAFPNAWPILEDQIHRCLIRRFPFGLLYFIDNDEIIIVAIMNLRREPQYWKNRLK